jgi:hypothetical protein
MRAKRANGGAWGRGDSGADMVSELCALRARVVAHGNLAQVFQIENFDDIATPH